MVRYRRRRVLGGSYFFTLTLADRRGTALADHIGALRSAFHATKASAPFTVGAMVALPHHLHAILTLPRTTPTTQTVGAA
jgi:putative transposase